MTKEEVRNLLGKPDLMGHPVDEISGRREPGIEWQWGTKAKRLTLMTFDENGRFDHYLTTDRHLRSVEGIGVGDSRDALLEAYGGRLDTPVDEPSAFILWEKDRERNPALFFLTDYKHRIHAISGGNRYLRGDTQPAAR